MSNSLKDVIEKVDIKNVERGNAEQEITKCYSMDNPDMCIYSIAVLSYNKTGYRDGHLCGKIINSNVKGLCYFTYAKALSDIAICEKLEGDSIIYCRAFVKNDPSLCDEIPDKINSLRCREAVRKAIEKQ